MRQKMITRLIFLLALMMTSCSIWEEALPEYVNPQACTHVIVWNESTQRIEVEIHSDLDYVDVNMGQWTMRIAKTYYRCASLVRLGDEIEIVSEQICTYIL